MDSMVYFAAMMLSLALVHSMIYNSRRLEAIGYALSVLFLQQLIVDYEDIFLICPQFPVYVSPKDKELDPDTTMADSSARGVYVDHVILFPRAVPTGDTRATFKLNEVFLKAYGSGNCTLHRSLNITSLEVPLLEEKKRPFTRHPSDLEDHVSSIQDGLSAAETQVISQAKILFSSPRFATQDLVVLVASSGEYYSLAVLTRAHDLFLDMPTAYEVFHLLNGQQAEVDQNTLVEDLQSEFRLSPMTPNARDEHQRQVAEKAKKTEKKEQNTARDARAKARGIRKAALSRQKGLKRQLSELIIQAGDPPYSDEVVEAYYALSYEIYKSTSSSLQTTTFFEPEPLVNVNLYTLSDRRWEGRPGAVAFTGVIRVGSSVSEKFSKMIRDYLSRVGQDERLRRNDATYGL